MANKSVKKLASAEDQISGLKTSRYERGAMAYGVIEAADYAFNDTLSFDDINSKDIVEARVTAHAGNPTTVEVLPGTDVSDAIDLFVQNNEPVKLSYVIHYIRGAGKVGSDVSSGEGKVLRITVKQD